MVTVQTGSKLEAFFAEFYGENPIAKRFGMGFSQATVHALDRACTVASYEQLYHILENYYNTSFLFVI